MALANVIQLRQLLAEKFPGLRTRADDPATRSRPCWPTGLPQIDDPLGGGLAKAALTEVIVPHRTSGAASLIAHLLRQAEADNQFVALVDGNDTFDPALLDSAVLARMLWLRCASVDEALKAADLILRDGNLPVVMLDLALNPAAQLRKVPAPTWYRFQRIVEERGVTCIVFTPYAMVAPAEARLTLESRFTVAALERDSSEVMESLDIEVCDARRHSVTDEPLRRTA